MYNTQHWTQWGQGQFVMYAYSLREQNIATTQGQGCIQEDSEPAGVVVGGQWTLLPALLKTTKRQQTEGEWSEWRWWCVGTAKLGEALGAWVQSQLTQGLLQRKPCCPRASHRMVHCTQQWGTALPGSAAVQFLLWEGPFTCQHNLFSLSRLKTPVGR